MQTLAVGTKSVKELLLDVNEHGLIQLGSDLQLTEGWSGHGDGQARFHLQNAEVKDAVWDPFSSSTILLTSTSVFQLTHDNTVNLLAGNPSGKGAADGRGSAALFYQADCVTSDGAGALYVSEGQRIRRVQLPASLQGRWPSAGSAVGSGQSDVSVDDQVIVSTLPFQAASAISDLACVSYAGGSSSSSNNSNRGSIGGSSSSRGSTGGSLVFATGTALYRVALSGEGSSEPELWVGDEEAWGGDDGVGPQARFDGIEGIAADGHGSIFITDLWDEEESCIRKVAPCGEVTTVVPSLDGVDHSSYVMPSILPNGFLAVVQLGGNALYLMDLKLQPIPLTASAAAPPAPAGSPPRTLSSDLAALLDRQPDGTADVTLLVGDRSFPAHRGILVARSDYFRQRLEGGFADGSSTQLSLPEADPEAFAVVLRFMYTGAAEIPSAVVTSVAALADRLLLPELCQAAQAQVLAEVRPETVVERLLWAEVRGPCFIQLLAVLKEWYLEHHDEVVAVAADSVKRLMVESPDLAMQLYVLGKRVRLQ